MFILNFKSYLFVGQHQQVMFGELLRTYLKPLALVFYSIYSILEQASILDSKTPQSLKKLRLSWILAMH